MPLLKILKYPNPLLRKRSKAVKKIDGAISKLVADMAETMHLAPGVGLAGPQVGELVRVIVVDIGEGLIAIINPKVVKRGGEQTYVEGCLSLPKLEGPVTRSSSVAVTGLDEKGRPVTLEAVELLATVIQHEIDHLDGKLFIDRVKDPSDIRTVTKEMAARRDKVCIKDKAEECRM